MKFGHNLPRNQVPEWASAYIDYKGLKKLIKTAAQKAKEGKETDLAGMSLRLLSMLNTFIFAYEPFVILPPKPT
jgi:SPX domain protein involved in polyphosphate accumulation